MMKIEFDEPFDLIPGVIEPACLPTKSVEVGTKCYTSGWGITKRGWLSFTSVKLRAVDVSIKDDQECLEKLKDLEKPFNPESEICAYSEGKDSCQGDSGGLCSGIS